MRPHYMLAFTANYLAQMASSVPTSGGKDATLSYILHDTTTGSATKCADLTTDVSGYELSNQCVTSSIRKTTMFALDLFSVGLTTFAMPTFRKREFLPFVILAAPSYIRAGKTTVLEDTAELSDVDYRGGSEHGDSSGSSGGKNGESGGDSGNSGVSHESHTEGIVSIAPGLKSIAISAQNVCTLGLAITILSEHPYSSVALTVFSLVNHVTADWIKIGEQENQDFTSRIQKRKRAPEQPDNKASSLDDTKGNELTANSIRFKSKLLRRDKDFDVADGSQNTPSKIHETGDFDNNKRDGLDVSSTATADLTQEPSLTTTAINKRQGSGGVADASENSGEKDFNYDIEQNIETCGRDLCDFNRRQVTDDPANQNRNEASDNLPNSTPTSGNTTNTSLIAFAGVVFVVIAFCGYIQFKKY